MFLVEARSTPQPDTSNDNVAVDINISETKAGIRERIDIAVDALRGRMPGIRVDHLGHSAIVHVLTSFANLGHVLCELEKVKAGDVTLHFPDSDGQTKDGRQSEGASHTPTASLIA